MNNVLQPSFVDDARPQEKPGFEVVVFYDTIQGGFQAMDLFQRLVRELGEEFQLKLNLWKLAVLQLPAAAERAEADALRADLMILAFEDSQAISPERRKWVESWMAKKRGQESALVVLYHRGAEWAEGIESVREHLRTLAMRGGMRFLTHGFGAGPGGRQVRTSAQGRRGLDGN